jgi:hypothetical protein
MDGVPYNSPSKSLDSRQQLFVVPDFVQEMECSAIRWNWLRRTCIIKSLETNFISRFSITFSIWINFQQRISGSSKGITLTA